MTAGTRHPRITEAIFFGFLLATSLAGLWHAGNFTDFFRMSTFTFSHWYSVLIGAVCGLEIYRCLRSPAIEPPERGAGLKTLCFAILVAAYAIVLHGASYYLATALFIPLAFLLLRGISSWCTAIFATTGWLLFVYLVFEKLFSIILPR